MTLKEDQIKYKIKIDKIALKFLENLDDFKYNNIIEEIFKLEHEPRPVGCVKLNTKSGYRIKWSKYRILFTIDDLNKTIIIYKIGHRKDVYKTK
ncbi:MAG: type II toxin-antitoxin system RelE/ParE family toxin [Candidatus Kapabacteria bacterium]|nr:type II toxin-antitoxin system RelE/ParE family toxin [Candidatus Kapabacteria bacterium]